MAYCYDKGLPHSEFLSWDPEDRAKMLAFMAEKSLTCSMCGTAPWQWDPYQGGDSHAYVPIPVKCEGCAAKDQARETMTDSHSKGPGIQISLVPAAVAAKMEKTARKRPRSKREKAGRGGRRSLRQ